MGKEGEKYSVDLADGSEKLLFPTEKMLWGKAQMCRHVGYLYPGIWVSLGFIWLMQRACVGENVSAEEEIHLLSNQKDCDLHEGRRFVCQVHS